MQKLSVIAARVPQGIDLAGSFRAFALFAPPKIPVKHGKKTDSTVENVTSSV
jgi:hypothetical protein